MLHKYQNFKKSSKSKKVIILCGITASGKSGLAVDLAETLEGVIINADSMQIYNALHIITAQPTEDYKNRVPHFLYSVLDPVKICSVAYFRDLAIEKINSALTKDKIPVVVGGTGLYINALLNGVSSIPDVDPNVRVEIRNLYNQLGQKEFYNALCRQDPAAQSYIGAHDRQRMIRAAEVFKSTGKTLKYWWGEDKKPYVEYDAIVILLIPDRNGLQTAFKKRIEKMIVQGAVQEIKLFNEKYPHILGGVANAIGVSELTQFLNGQINLDETIDRMLISTRQYAKRQATWFNHQLGGEYLRIDQPYSGQMEILQRVLDFINAR